MSVTGPASKIKALRAPDGAWEIPIVGEVGNFSGDMLLDFLMHVKPSEVKFLVRSPGGTVFDVFDAIDYMNANGITSYTEVYGDCMSAVTLLAAHSTPARTAVTPSSRFGIHKASGPIGDQVFVAHANERIASMYKDAYGWSPSKIEKLLTDGDGTGTVWMGEEIIAAGIATELLTELKVAARMDRVDQIINENTPDMGKITVKAHVKLTPVEAIKALSGVDTDVTIEPTTDQAALKEVADTATKDRIAAEAKAKEATDELEKAKAKEAEVLAKVTEAEAATAAAEATVTEVTAKLTAETAKVTALEAEKAKLVADVRAFKALPTAKAITLSDVGEAIEPGEAPAPATGGQSDEEQQMRRVADKIEARRKERK